MKILLKDKFSNYFCFLNESNSKTAVNLNHEINKTQQNLDQARTLYIKENKIPYFDFSIQCDSKTFSINKMVLMNSSLFFENLIKSELNESKKNSFTLDTKFINFFNKIINFMNKENFENSASEILEILDISHYFMIDNLTALIESELEKLISKLNFLI